MRNPGTWQVVQPGWANPGRSRVDLKPAGSGGVTKTRVLAGFEYPGTRMFGMYPV